MNLAGVVRGSVAGAARPLRARIVPLAASADRADCAQPKKALP